MSIKTILPLLISLLFSLSINYAQTTIAKQSFEQNASDTWSMTLSTPACTSGSDSWDYRTSLSTITPNDGSQFWGITDLNGSCGGSNFETISLPNVDVSSFTGVDFSFDYNVKGFDPGDDMKYELFYDNVSQGEVIFVNGSNNFTTSGWVTETVTIPGGVTNVSVILYVKQDGGSDYAGFDNIVLEGTLACTPATIASVSPTSATVGSTVTITASSGDLTGGAVSFNGVSATVTSSNTTTIVCTVPAGATSGDLTITDNQPCDVIYSTFTVLCSADAEPTSSSTSLNFSTLNCDNYTLNWVNGDGANRVVIMSTLAVTGIPIDQTAYTANSVFGNGATLVAGEFFVYNGSGNSVTVTGLTPNTNYFVSIFEYNGTTANCTENYLVSSSLSGSQTTAVACLSSCPQVKSILVNACSTGSEEGLNEYIVFKNGSSVLNIADISIEFPSEGTYCNSGCGTQTIGSNAAYIASLNATAGCSKFIYLDPIPAGALVIVFTGQTPSYNYDFSSMCVGGEQVVALFCNNIVGGGRYGNSSGENKTTTMTWGSCSQTATFFSSSANTGTDGDFANFDALGAVSYSNDGNCLATPLPAELNYFEAVKAKSGVELTWETWNEIDAAYFELYKSSNGIDYQLFNKIDASGTSNEVIQYKSLDPNPTQGLSYYRLGLVNNNGEKEVLANVVFKQIQSNIAVTNHAGFWSIAHPEITEGIMEIYSIGGTLISTTSLNDEVTKYINTDLPQGVYLISITSDNSSWTTKLIK